MLKLTEPVDIRVPVPGAIRRARIAAGMTQARLCAAAGIGISTLEKLERGGDRGAGQRVRSALASALGATEDDLFAPPTAGVTEAAELIGHCRRTIRLAIDSGDLRTLPNPPLPALEDLPEWMTVRQVCELAGESQPTINKHMTELEGRRQPDGSWRVPRETALEYARGRETRDRMELEELSRWAEDYDRQVADRAAPVLRCFVCGEEFMRRRSAVRDITRSFCTLDHYFEHRRTEASARAQAVPRGGCGSPTCSDPRCKVRSGRCHRDKCDRPAAIATETRERHRHVVDEPTLYCTQRCAVLARNRGDAYRESQRELTKAGYVLTARNAERLLGRSKPVICKWAKALELGRQLRGDDGQLGPLRFCKDDIDRLQDALQPWDHLSPRERDLGEWGRVAPVLAEQRGTHTGRKRSYSEDEAERVHQLRSAGKTLTQIELSSGLSRDQVRRILGLRA
jgi:transcriptional regulator with XRE-family HTH domain